jgi:lysophospholipase L1-like esterase
MMGITINKGDVLLFQGDSVTEGSRVLCEPGDIGTGYVGMIRDMLNERYPGRDLTVLNRGISGNKVSDLARRWDADCEALKPDVVTILIGINDTWHRFKHGSGHVTDMMFYDDYREILEKTKKLTDRILLMEPFLLPVDEEMHGWRGDLDGKIHAARRLAVEFGALYVPLDGLFAAAYARDGMELYAPDGVHPTAAGCGLIAGAWADAVYA